jgi:hypothetical protein
MQTLSFKREVQLHGSESDYIDQYFKSPTSKRMVCNLKLALCSQFINSLDQI